MYKACTIVPCMHTFCAGCLSQWLDAHKDCPVCRSNVQSTAPAHLVRNLVEEFLLENPEHKRDQEDLDELDRLSKLTDEYFRNRPQQSTTTTTTTSSSSWSHYHTPARPAWGNLGVLNFEFGTPPVVDDDEGDDEYGDYSDDDYDARVMPSTATQVSNACLECVTARADDGFQCDPNNTHHVPCSMCLEPVPDRALTSGGSAGSPPIRCVLCMKVFCGLYWTCRSVRGQNALRALEDWTWNKVPPRALSDNMVELKFLKQYMDSKSVTPDDLFARAMAGLESGDIVYTDPETGGELDLERSHATCHACAENVFRDLLFSVYKAVPKADLPSAARSRPDCHYGAACRTQKHNIAHAKKYNHVVDQTRF